MHVTPLGRIIRIARLATGTTLYDMSVFMGEKPSTLCAYETGKKHVTDEYLENVARFLEGAELESRNYLVEARRVLDGLIENQDPLAESIDAEQVRRNLSRVGEVALED